MSKNLIPKIAKMLGIEIGEEFGIDFLKDTYRFSDKRLECLCIDDQSWRIVSDQVLKKILCGEYNIVKLLWKPKDGENYWTFNSYFAVIETCWDGSCEDYMRLKCGVVFRNSKEATEKLAEAYKEITGEDWE